MKSTPVNVPLNIIILLVFFLSVGGWKNLNASNKRITTEVAIFTPQQLHEFASKLQIQQAEDHRQVMCMAITVYGEVGTEPNNLEDIKGVANVIDNRRDHPAFPNDACKVVMQKNQFEPIAVGKRLRKYVVATQLGNPIHPTNINQKTFWKVYSIAKQVYLGNLPDNTNGAIGFFSPSAQQYLKREEPAFAKKMQLVAVIGKQKYYR